MRLVLRAIEPLYDNYPGFMQNQVFYKFHNFLFLLESAQGCDLKELIKQSCTANMLPKYCNVCGYYLDLFQPSTLETESEEYRSHNNTESDIEIQEKGLVIIQDVNTVRSFEAHWKEFLTFMQ